MQFAQAESPKQSKSHYLWAVLTARIYEVYPLLRPNCVGQMRLIAFITKDMQVRHPLACQALSST